MTADASRRPADHGNAADLRSTRGPLTETAMDRLADASVLHGHTEAQPGSAARHRGPSHACLDAVESFLAHLNATEQDRWWIRTDLDGGLRLARDDADESISQAGEPPEPSPGAHERTLTGPLHFLDVTRSGAALYTYFDVVARAQRVACSLPSGMHTLAAVHRAAVEHAQHDLDAITAAERVVTAAFSECRSPRHDPHQPEER
ncbi:hypothetical protein [Nocardioides sp. Leaf285]|uniref:hypothetical protein n=1 Tax=Nocardioides sp. Leaf285 TaxID=1736322 RepID=UPI00070389ED|nr:hypothetical protein [Nocardioides sp. Leaf285]KQP62948.1 hypothetical protein ASF47_18215 [Nocardioides sp. Leaf285]